MASYSIIFDGDIYIHDEPCWLVLSLTFILKPVKNNSNYVKLKAFQLENGY